MIKVAFEESTILPSQSDWLNKDYDDMWNQEVMPLYMLCLEKCTVLAAHNKKDTVVCTKFKTSQENIIEFYPHWQHPKLNEIESTHKYLVLELTNNYI